MFEQQRIWTICSESVSLFTAAFSEHHYLFSVRDCLCLWHWTVLQPYSDSTDVWKLNVISSVLLVLERLLIVVFCGWRSARHVWRLAVLVASPMWLQTSPARRPRAAWLATTVRALSAILPLPPRQRSVTNDTIRNLHSKTVTVI